MLYEVKDKVVFITGGAIGIGAALVRAFLEENAKYVAVLDIDVTNGKALEAELAAKYGAEKIKFYKCDVTTKDLDDIYDAVIKEAGFIDCVINNAGIMNDGPDMFVKSIEINVTAVIRSSFKAFELMRKDHGGKGGAIVNISSTAALFPSSVVPVYGATKAAVLKFSNSLGSEPHYTRSGVRVVTICFGPTDTSIFDKTKYAHMDKECDDEDLIGIATEQFGMQTIESAINGFIEAYKRGSSASTWYIASDKPAQDITENVLGGYGISRD